MLTRPSLARIRRNAAPNARPAAAISDRPRPTKYHGVPSVKVASRSHARQQRGSKSADRTHERERQQRSGEQARRIEKRLADARVAEHEMQRAADPAIERLIVERPAAALEPEAVHVDPAARDLIRQPVVPRIRAHVSDQRNRSRDEVGEPGHADHHEHGAQMASRRPDRNPDAADQQQSDRALESSGHRRGDQQRGGGGRPGQRPRRRD